VGFPAPAAYRRLLLQGREGMAQHRGCENTHGDKDDVHQYRHETLSIPALSGSYSKSYFDRPEGRKSFQEEQLVLQIHEFRLCTTNRSCTRSRESAPIVLVCTVLHQPQIETSVTFCGMVWLRTVVLGRIEWTESIPSKSECSILPTVRHLRDGYQQHPVHSPASRVRMKGRELVPSKGCGERERRNGTRLILPVYRTYLHWSNRGLLPRSGRGT
jgi:hypothetical protein